MSNHNRNQTDRARNLPPSLEVVREEFQRSATESQSRRTRAESIGRRRRVLGSVATLAAGIALVAGPLERGQHIGSFPGYAKETIFGPAESQTAPVEGAPTEKDERKNAIKLIEEYQDK